MYQPPSFDPAMELVLIIFFVCMFAYFIWAIFFKAEDEEDRALKRYNRALRKNNRLLQKKVNLMKENNRKIRSVLEKAKVKIADLRACGFSEEEISERLLGEKEKIEKLSQEWHRISEETQVISERSNEIQRGGPKKFLE